MFGLGTLELDVKIGSPAVAVDLTFLMLSAITSVK